MRRRRRSQVFVRSLYILSVSASMVLVAIASSSFAQDTSTDAPPKKVGDATATESDAPKVDPGQSDLDEAVIARIDAESMKQLEAVTALLESALAKGLTDENASFAKKMLGSVQLQQSQLLVGQMMRSRGRRQQETLREDALEKLESAVKNDSGLVEAYLLIARMNLLPNGSKDAITEATTKAIELLDDDPSEKSAALVLRALTYDLEDDKRAADLDAAIKADKENLDAFRERAAVRMQKKDIDGAVKDLMECLKIDPTNQRVVQGSVSKLIEINRTDDALNLITKSLEAKPSEGLYKMRAMLYRMDGKEKEALEDINKAIDLQPRDPIALIQRAEIALDRKDVKSAKADLRSARRIAPQVDRIDSAIIVSCRIAIEEGRMADAINEMKKLVDRHPDSSLYQSQLANLYLSDERPRKAIETLSNILDRDPKNISVIRSRGDALLAVGEHQKAIDDYERAIKVYDESTNSDYDLSGILNNLSWVLSTSPNDKIRNGKRAVELGIRAVEMTEEKEAHILSTLAAGYAEVGDFKKAIEWSTKCVELGKSEEHDQLDQLEKELESYKAGKPWREKQETEENAVPIISAEDLIDT